MIGFAECGREREGAQWQVRSKNTNGDEAQAEKQRNGEEDEMSDVDSEEDAPLDGDTLMRLGLDDVNEEIEYSCQVVQESEKSW